MDEWSSPKMYDPPSIYPLKPALSCLFWSTQIVHIPIGKSSDNTEGYCSFRFSLSSIQGDPNGSYDCVQQDTTRYVWRCWFGCLIYVVVSLNLNGNHIQSRNVLEGTVLFFWNQYPTVVRKRLSPTTLAVRVIIKKYTFYESWINELSDKHKIQIRYVAIATQRKQ